MNSPKVLKDYLYFHEPGPPDIKIYLGDCLSIMPLLDKVDLVVTDPPYGIGADKNLRANKQHGKAAAPSKDYGVGNWDSQPVSKATLDMIIAHADKSIVWGGNFFEVVPSSGWLVWDKDNGNNGYADCELAWTNLKQAIRRIKYKWMGMIQEHMGDLKEHRWHPTQKPLAVMKWAILQAPQEMFSDNHVLDPFLGSGTTLVACKELKRNGIGIEINEKYCEIAKKRLQNTQVPFL